MQYSEMWHCANLVRNNVSEESVASIIRVVKINLLRNWLEISYVLLTLFLARSIFHHNDGGETFPRNIGSCKNLSVSHLRRRHSSVTDVKTSDFALH
jgi:hypothetical protein